ncbi:hypothetical protein ACFVYJ_01610 [Pontibacter sp. JAM-7]|uniref:hypothetical protein n=1 Tax=Pontibacter sp. JAM-7 TaxID=3366581 RepID=UPI003AF8212D
MSRYAENIRRIVGIKNTNGGIDAQDELSPIRGRRGIAYFNADGTIGSSSGSTGSDGSTPTTQPDDAQSGDQAATSDSTTGSTTSGGGGGSLPADSGTTSNPAAGNSVDADDLFGGSLGVGDSFSSMGGLFECGTTKEFQLNFDGQWPDIDGWDDPDTLPPVDDGTFEAGYFWYWPGAFGGAEQSIAPTATEAAQNAVSLNAAWSSLVSVGDPYPEGHITLGYTSDMVAVATFNKTSGGTATWGIYRAICGSSSGGVAEPATCVTGLPNYETKWPSDGVTQLAFNAETAKWESSAYDPDTPANYQQPKSMVCLCSASGDNICSTATKDGEAITINYDKGIYIVRGQDGKIKAAGGMSDLNSWLP